MNQPIKLIEDNRNSHEIWSELVEEQHDQILELLRENHKLEMKILKLKAQILKVKS